MIIRIILFLILFYILIKVAKFVIKFVIEVKDKQTFQRNQTDNPSSNKPGESKYKNVEEAKFTEIKPDDKTPND